MNSSQGSLSLVVEIFITRQKCNEHPCKSAFGHKTTQEINTSFPQLLSCKAVGLCLNAKGICEERDMAGCMPRTVFLPRTAARWNQAVLQEAI